MAERDIKLARYAALERYEDANQIYLDLDSKLQGCAKNLTEIARRLVRRDVDLVEQDYMRLPDIEEFSQIIGDFKAARLNLQRTRLEARRNGWQLDDPNQVA